MCTTQLIGVPTVPSWASHISLLQYTKPFPSVPAQYSWSTGPNHSIICFFTLTGHGAAAWMTHRSDDTSYLARTAGSSFSSRMNMVGTTWVTVTR